MRCAWLPRRVRSEGGPFVGAECCQRGPDGLEIDFRKRLRSPYRRTILVDDSSAYAFVEIEAFKRAMREPVFEGEARFDLRISPREPNSFKCGDNREWRVAGDDRGCLFAKRRSP